MMYYAIIGDIKESKKLENRGEIQEKIKNVLRVINTQYSEDIAAKFLITLGDEFQGLLKEASNILEIIKYIQREMYPIELRFGIGIGEIYTKIDSEAAIGADGPAFYAARNVITEIKKQEKKVKHQAPDIQIEFFEKNYFEVREINIMFSLLKTIEDGWNEKQRYTIWDMIRYQESQDMCARRQNTTQSTVARRLSGGKYLVYNKAIATVKEAIQRLEKYGCS